MARNKTIFFIDMDGTVADFYHTPNFLQDMMKPGYFAELKPMAFATAINELALTHTVYILSACVKTTYCETEKRNWTKKFIPNIAEENMIFCKVGENKADIVRERLNIRKLNKHHVLIDDYTANLLLWEKAGGTGIKKLNGINNKSGNWKGAVAL